MYNDDRWEPPDFYDWLKGTALTLLGVIMLLGGAWWAFKPWLEILK